MSRWCLLLLLALPLAGQTVAIQGTFHYPNAVTVNGYLTVALTRTTAMNTCVKPARLVTFQSVRVQITNGTMGALTLYKTSCLSPSVPYRVRVYDRAGKMLYQGSWTVPDSTPPVDVTLLGEEP